MKRTGRNESAVTMPVAIGAVTGNGRIAEEPVDHSHVAAQPGACASRKTECSGKDALNQKTKWACQLK